MAATVNIINTWFCGVRLKWLGAEVHVEVSNEWLALHTELLHIPTVVASKVK